MFTWDLLFGAVVFGLLVGCFYAAVSIGLSVSFGLLDVPHIAHPSCLGAGAYGAWWLGGFGWDPIVAGLVLALPFFIFGVVMYRIYHVTFEKRGSDAGLRRIVESAGLDWREAQPLAGNDDWRAEAEANRQELFGLGLWGVPCFRFGETTAWGQDRLWVIEDAIRGHNTDTTGR